MSRARHFRSWNRTVFESAPESGTRRIRSQIYMTEMVKPETGAGKKWSRFMAPVSGACVMAIRNNTKEINDHETWLEYQSHKIMMSTASVRGTSHVPFRCYTITAAIMDVSSLKTWSWQQYCRWQSPITHKTKLQINTQHDIVNERGTCNSTNHNNSFTTVMFNRVTVFLSNVN